ncbi:MAG TPA: NAD(P)-binding domain-containing protein, partial [Vicingus sp.]|nr:NAD(P)-binding domain-containing protein [Vicingus sp.]
MKEIKNISFIGSGNVASHLAIALFRNNFSIKQVFSKSFKNANSLAKKVNAQPIESMSQLS